MCIRDRGITTATNNVYVNLSTNANAGGTIYIYDANGGLLSPTAGGYVLPSISADLSSGSVSEGYGAIYNTTSQTSGGPMEALSPFNGSGSVVGNLQTTVQSMFDSTSSPVTGGQVSFTLKAKAKNTTPAANDYSDTLTVLVAGSF